MKKLYNSPIFDAVKLTSADIMNGSGEPTVNMLDATDFTSGDYVPFGQIQENP